MTIVEALWLLYSYYDAPGLLIGCPTGFGSCVTTPYGSIPGTHSVWALILLVILFVVGALGAWGASVAYPTGSALSAVTLLLTGFTALVTHSYGNLSAVTDDAILGVAFSLVAIIVNLQAMRVRSGLPEQANPMNLPVFG